MQAQHLQAQHLQTQWQLSVDPNPVKGSTLTPKTQIDIVTFDTVKGLTKCCRSWTELIDRLPHYSNLRFEKTPEYAQVKKYVLPKAIQRDMLKSWSELVIAAAGECIPGVVGVMLSRRDHTSHLAIVSEIDDDISDKIAQLLNINGNDITVEEISGSFRASNTRLKPKTTMFNYDMRYLRSIIAKDESNEDLRTEVELIDWKELHKQSVGIVY